MSSDKKSPSLFSQITEYVSFGITNGQALFHTAWFFGRQLGWFVVTVGMITALPLIFEVKREEALEFLEQQEVSKLINEGKTPQELAMQGMASAVAPAVLNDK